jgi:DNA-binding IclR family transcriptional regulator
MSVTEIGDALDIHKSTAFRMLATLEQKGFVTQEEERGKYRLGRMLVYLAEAVNIDTDLLHASRPVCKWLSEVTQETVNVAVLEKHEVVNIDQVIGSSGVVSNNWVGKRNPLSCTSTGKVLVAFALRKSVSLDKCTEHSIDDLYAFHKQLEDIRQKGYGFTLEELELGLNAVAAPIYSMAGTAIAALSVSGPSYRVTKERIPELGELTKQAGLEISQKLGYVQRANI